MTDKSKILLAQYILDGNVIFKCCIHADAECPLPNSYFFSERTKNIYRSCKYHLESYRETGYFKELE